MIQSSATAHRSPLVLRVAAPLAWRTDEKIAKKLMGFAATEQGSALDMFRAAELEADPKLSRLFFHHAMDEARHAQHFREVAKQVVGGTEVATRSWESLHAVRQDLYEQLGVVRFVAFVWLSESRAKKQFEVLCGYFHDRPELHRLFSTIAKDEHFHATYSRHILDSWIAEGREREVAKAIRAERMRAAWTRWRNAGRQIGDLMAKLLMTTLFVVVLPLFALIERVARKDTRGWQAPAAGTGIETHEDAWRQF